MSGQLVSLDLETNGVNVDQHQAWEVGLVEGDGIEHLYQFALYKDFINSEPASLIISGFYDRYVLEGFSETVARDMLKGDSRRNLVGEHIPDQAKDICRKIAKITDGAHLMGCAISFDMKFLSNLMLYHGVVPSWHHRGLDLGSYCAGIARADKPFASKTMAEKVPNEYAHTALGDAKWNWEVYNRYKHGIVDANA